MPVLESFGRAPMKAKLLNLTALLFSFLAFVGCCVGFGAALLSVSLPTIAGRAEWTFYQSYIQTEANRIDYSNSVTCSFEFCSKCHTGGQGFLAMLVLAFLTLVTLICILTFRIFGGVAISALANPQRSITVESWTALCASGLYLLGTIIFGATCYRETHSTDGFQVTMTGFAYIIVSFFFTFLTIILYYFIRIDPRCHLGTPTGGSGGSGEFDSLNDDLISNNGVGGVGERRPSIGGRTDPHQGSYEYGSTYQQSSPPSEAFMTRPVRGQQ